MTHSPGERTAQPGASVLGLDGLEELVQALRADGYRVAGPVLGEDAVTLAEVQSVADLARGWGVETDAGRYRLHPRADGALFAHSAGPQSWKQFLHPPQRATWTFDGTEFRPADREPVRWAFLGVRACDLAAIAILRGVLTRGRDDDDALSPFLVAVGCTEPGAVCFCASAGTGPQPGPGYDLALTELIDERGHRFVTETGTPRGGQMLERVTARAAQSAEVDDARAAVARAGEQMTRRLPDVDLRAMLVAARESPHWEDVAARCLTCGNCTAVCPTCFCTSSTESTALGETGSEHTERWASCFEVGFSHLHGGSVRTSGASRYRQWMSHKLSTWYDQFGTSGCVGCGRCIAWCPAGIDITAEAAALAADPTTAAGTAAGS